MSKVMEEGVRPPIVCLCGSTRFYREFVLANYLETLAGKIVLSVGFYANAKESDWQVRKHGELVGITSQQKAGLDELHRRKIDLADEVLVLDVGGYVGDSTRGEIQYARLHDKKVRYLSQDPIAAEINLLSQAPIGSGASASQVGGDHYRSKTIQPWDYIAANHLGFFEGNIVRYITRWRQKGGIEDLKKLIHYAEKLIELEEAGHAPAGA